MWGVRSVQTYLQSCVQLPYGVDAEAVRYRRVGDAAGVHGQALSHIVAGLQHTSDNSQMSQHIHENNLCSKQLTRVLRWRVFGTSDT